MPNIIRKKRGCSQIKIPKTFTLEKEGLDKSLEQLISKDYYSLSSVTSLLNSFDTFMQRINPVPDFLCPLYRMYEIGEEMSKKFLYTKRDIEELSKRIPFGREYDKYLGFYLSALINKIIKEEDTITLTLKERLNGIGSYLQGGTLKVQGSLEDWTCFHMKEGIVILKGDIEEFLGSYMAGGEARIYGKIKQVSRDCKGKIYRNDRLIIPRKNSKWTHLIKKIHLKI